MQDQFRCAAYANIAQWCSTLLQKTVKWRDATKCRNNNKTIYFTIKL
jgi:hypothetical protein